MGRQPSNGVPSLRFTQTESFSDVDNGFKLSHPRSNLYISATTRSLQTKQQKEGCERGLGFFYRGNRFDNTVTTVFDLEFDSVCGRPRVLGFVYGGSTRAARKV